MNIVEAYTKFNGQLIIYISGLSGCKKTNFAKKIANTFKIHLLEQFDYYKKDYENKVTLQDGSKVTNFSTDDAFDWDKLNNDINEKKNKGVVVSGICLPEKLTVMCNFHLHISISKANCIKKRNEFLEKHKDKYPIEFAEIDSIVEKLKMNQLIFPYYIDSIQRSKINKFFNMNKIQEDEVIWDQIWEYLINAIDSYVNWFNTNKYNEWKYKQRDSIYT
jgi:cytidylate kinase